MGRYSGAADCGGTGVVFGVRGASWVPHLGRVNDPRFRFAQILETFYFFLDDPVKRSVYREK